MKNYTIGEIARYAGIEPSAIRYYESVGLLPAPKRVNNRRRYDISVLQRIALIQLTRRAGFRISELQLMFTGFEGNTSDAAPWQSLAAAKVAEMDALIERTQTIKAWLQDALEHECLQDDECISVTLDESGSGMQVRLSVEDLKVE